MEIELQDFYDDELVEVVLEEGDHVTFEEFDDYVFCGTNKQPVVVEVDRRIDGGKTISDFF